LARIDLGYDTFTTGLYQWKMGASSLQPQNPAWMRWRANKITLLMTKIFQAVKTCRPNCLVTIAPNPQNFAYLFTGLANLGATRSGGGNRFTGVPGGFKNLHEKN